MLNWKSVQNAARLAMAGVCVLLCCACLVSLYQNSAGHGAPSMPLGSLGSLWFSALACGGVAGVCIRSFFVQAGHALASAQIMPWLVLAAGVAAVLCLASLVGNVALRQLLLL